MLVAQPARADDAADKRGIDGDRRAGARPGRPRIVSEFPVAERPRRLAARGQPRQHPGDPRHFLVDTAQAFGFAVVALFADMAVTARGRAQELGFGRIAQEADVIAGHARNDRVDLVESQQDEHRNCGVDRVDSGEQRVDLIADASRDIGDDQPRVVGDLFAQTDHRGGRAPGRAELRAEQGRARRHGDQRERQRTDRVETLIERVHRPGTIRISRATSRFPRPSSWHPPAASSCCRDRKPRCRRRHSRRRPCCA